MTEPHVLCIDGHNFLHRARSGFTAGQYAVIFNFFRALRAQVELHKPTRIYIAMEGHPKARHDMLPHVGEPGGVGKAVGYKANRIIEPGTAKADAHMDFIRQATLIMELLRCFPVSVVRHPDYEADDTISNLIRRSTSAVSWTVLSNDSDFIQLLDRFQNVKLYNPMTKAFVEAPQEYAYLFWKALRGDGSDNIPGIPGIGDKTAAKLASDPEEAASFFGDKEHGAERNAIYQRNMKLIRFADWSDEEMVHMTSSSPTRDWETVRNAFEAWDFKSLLKQPTWDKFTATFDALWG